MPELIPTKPATYSEKIVDELINPRIPDDTGLPEKYWGLAGGPSTHLEFTQIPDSGTLMAIQVDMDILYKIMSHAGMRAFQNQQQLKLINKLMLLKSVGYAKTPTLMENILSSLQAMRVAEQEKKADQSYIGPLYEYIRGGR